MELLVGLLTAFVLAVVPMLFYAMILWWFDRYEKEPLHLIAAAFFWGAVPAVVLSLVSQVLLDVPLSELADPGLGTDLLSASLIAPLTEEPFKGLALLLLFIFYRREIDTPLDGILYGGLVGFGFATTENLFYFLHAFDVGGVVGTLKLAFFRAVLFGLNHALFTGCTGLGFALARTSPRWAVKITAPFLGLGAGITFHALHNAGATLAVFACWPLLFSFVSDWGGVLMLFAIIVWASVRERAWIAQYLKDEVQRGTISEADYRVIQSYWARVRERTWTLLRGDVVRWWRLGKYYRLATELAFAKHRRSDFKRERETHRRIQRLRRQLRALRVQMGDLPPEPPSREEE
ncbi:MAG TPA: PrsW family intramembrane metalloprotease [Thermoflexia bacterium]|jgi:RsiW-degrading membrane proteinase PrsW (M82 family)|nr:PrsW family intramembrane metalloprotease [Thermoflexia bacterium]